MSGVTGKIDETRLFKVFLLIVNPQDVNFRSLFKFGLETDQFFEQVRPKLPDYEDERHGRMFEWVRSSGLAWIIVSELNIALVKVRKNKQLSFTYLYGRDSLAQLILNMRSKTGNKLIRGALEKVVERENEGSGSTESSQSSQRPCSCSNEGKDSTEESKKSDARDIEELPIPVESMCPIHRQLIYSFPFTKFKPSRSQQGNSNSSNNNASKSNSNENSEGDKRSNDSKKDGINEERRDQKVGSQSHGPPLLH